MHDNGDIIHLFLAISVQLKGYCMMRFELKLL